MRGPNVRRAVPLAALIIVMSVGVARAGVWYYDWSCAGECAPDRLTIEGREGPYLSREDCDFARDHDLRADEFVRQGNLGGLTFCYEKPLPPSSGYVPTSGPVAPAPPNKVRMVSIEVGAMLGTGWTATGESGMSASGPLTLGVELDSHSGRDIGGGALQVGLYGTWLEAPMLGDSPRSVMALPFSVGLALTPKLAGGTKRAVRLDLGASAGGLLLFGCSDCPGPVFDETLTFGYTLKAGVDIYTSETNGYSVDVVFPRWRMGSATPGNLLLESPAWLLRVSIIGRPQEP